MDFTCPACRVDIRRGLVRTPRKAPRCPACSVALRKNTHPTEKLFDVIAVILVIVTLTLFWFEYVELGLGVVALTMVVGFYVAWFYLVRLKSWPRWTIDKDAL